MSYSIVITETALNDMDNIYEYITYHLKEPVIAADLLGRLEVCINSLDEMPFKFREYEVEPWRSKGMHIMSVDNYVVLYTPNEDRQVVTINRVFYGGMDIPNQM
ncbi:MAG: type II toxin-antitoxin system RelE/ParE family toxin [Ruminococcus sp.]|uniref:type II toxin-antitoxin system RelE/ParE family toxin n=1 Tax=Ruminococcus sp. TaxID=41978 RepID=UPI0025DD3058|nr:type II toxin-antitoxin system RelE/ParE family toxin [Ruminococcus sp.]MBO4865724.1 type II toxin-antitoxin system RelE/ParE family toxin [Ruminococcus sp.]